MNRILLFIFVSCAFLLGCHQSTEVQEPKPEQEHRLSSPFFGLKGGDEPQILAPGIISTAVTEYNGTFSPSGEEFFYTSQAAGIGYITHMKMEANGSWSTPEIAEFSGDYSEYDPLFAPDGKRLYFSSERPVKDTVEYVTHIWYCEKHSGEWGSPTHLPLSGNGDYFSSITNDGSVYFNIWNTGKIMKANVTDSLHVIEELPEIINSRSDAGDPFISPSEDYIIYRAYYNGGFGRGDLYISFNIDNQWTEPENLGPTINSHAHEICPYVTTDGELFIFSSDRIEGEHKVTSLKDINEQHQSHNNGNSNIYYMSAKFIDEMKAKHIN